MSADELLKQLSDFYDQHKPSLKETHNGKVPPVILKQGMALLSEMNSMIPKVSPSFPLDPRWSDFLKTIESVIEDLYNAKSNTFLE
ncbi:MAG: hypothetical protein HY538_08295 [Deltaproteobacteria bacterium]|nr:hypothetical protein [Deltaproteobacteria bacterium]